MISACFHNCLFNLQQLYLAKGVAILLQRRGHATNITICIGSRVRTWAVAILSNAENFRCLYSYYGSCMPSSPKEYIRP